jgi:photoactive yellow protein
MLVEPPAVCTPAPGFGAPDILRHLDAADDTTLDGLSFGVIAMSSDGIVVAYNKAEAGAAGLRAERVIGRHFFTAVAPCTNNHLVAHRFESEPLLDATIDYTFTFKMAPKKVQLRMLRQPGARRMYLLVRWS